MPRHCFFGFCGAAAEDPFERADVVLQRLRVREQVHHHGRHIVPVGAAMAFHQPRGFEGIPAPLDHHGATGVDGREEAVDEAGDMKKRRRSQGHRVFVDMLPGRRAGHVVQHGRMGVHAAFRPAGAARGVGQHAQIVGLCAAGSWFCSRCLGFSCNEEMLKRQTRKSFGDILFGERDPGVAVHDVLPQFLRQVHRAHRHHHRIGAQDGEQGDDEVVAVLHVEQHPFAAPDRAGRLQVTGEVFDSFPQFGIAERKAVKNRGRLVREFPRRKQEHFLQRDARRAQRARHVGRPVPEVAGLHGREV